MHILDEKELKEALKKKDITKDEYQLVLQEKNKLLKEIEEGTNPLMKIDYKKYLGDF